VGRLLQQHPVVAVFANAAVAGKLTASEEDPAMSPTNTLQSQPAHPSPESLDRLMHAVAWVILHRQMRAHWSSVGHTFISSSRLIKAPS
jgi:hypothetical protein